VSDDRPRYYKLEGRRAMACPDAVAWAQWYETCEPAIWGWTAEFPGAARRSLFETMIFGAVAGTPAAAYCRRYASWEEAVAGHAEAVEIAVGVGLQPTDLIRGGGRGGEVSEEGGSVSDGTGQFENPPGATVGVDSLPEGDYAIVELIGHQTLVGRFAEVDRFGTCCGRRHSTG
jgi:hypothetical protein